MDPNASQYDVIIIGAGPAGFTAGIYAARAALKTLLIEGGATLSQISYADHIENFPGFPDGISGFDLNDRFRSQAKKLGVEIASGDVIEMGMSSAACTLTGSPGRKSKTTRAGWEVVTSGGTFRAAACIIATGASWKKMGIPGEEDLVGKGVSYCATCDAPFYREKEIIVIGGGDTAVGEAIYLSRFARKVTIVHRRDRLRACGLLQKRAFENSKVEFIWDAVPQKIVGEEHVTGLMVRNAKDPQETKLLPTEGIFILIGHAPNTGFARGAVEMDENGYILVNESMQTSAKGVFSCGDCNHKPLRQVVTACGDGAVAAFSAQLYLEELEGETE